MKLFEDAVKMLLAQQEQENVAENEIEFENPQPPAVTEPLFMETETEQAVYFDRGIDLDEIEQKEDYRSRRNISILD